MTAFVSIESEVVMYRLIIKYVDGFTNTYYLNRYTDCLAIIERELKINGANIRNYLIDEVNA